MERVLIAFRMQVVCLVRVIACSLPGPPDLGAEDASGDARLFSNLPRMTLLQPFPFPTPVLLPGKKKIWFYL